MNGTDIKMYDDHIALTHKHVAQIFAFSNFQRSYVFFPQYVTAKMSAPLCPPIDPKHPPRFRNISGKWNSIDHCDLYASYDDQSTNHNFILDEGAIHGNHNHHEHQPLDWVNEMEPKFLYESFTLFGGIP